MYTYLYIGCLVEVKKTIHIIHKASKPFIHAARRVDHAHAKRYPPRYPHCPQFTVTNCYIFFDVDTFTMLENPLHYQHHVAERGT
jgi:hypothetical protein